MDTVNYVNKVGKQINDSTKYNAKLDRTSITGLILISHLNKLLAKVTDDTELEQDLKEKALSKINGYINCLKKEMNFYPEKLIDPDCILTEVDEYIIQE